MKDQTSFSGAESPVGMSMARFVYLVQYDHDAPKDDDAPVTDEAVLAALCRFRDELRGIVGEVDSDAAVVAAPARPGQATARRIYVRTNVGVEMVDETVQRCADQNHLKAAILGCS